MHNGKYQCHMAASCTYHLPTITSQLLNNSHAKNKQKTKKLSENFLEIKKRRKEKKVLKLEQGENMKTERARGLGRKKKKKKGDRKGESNDNPEIPDRRVK